MNHAYVDLEFPTVSNIRVLLRKIYIYIYVYTYLRKDSFDFIPIYECVYVSMIVLVLSKITFHREKEFLLRIRLILLSITSFFSPLETHFR